MKRVVFCVLVVFALGACDSGDKKKDEAPAKPKTPVEEVLQKMKDFKEQMCACKDTACVERTEEGMMEWAMKNMEKMKDMKPSKEEEAVADKIDEEMDKCKARAEGAGAGTAAPAAPAPAAPEAPAPAAPEAPAQ